MRISDWSSDVCSSDLGIGNRQPPRRSLGREASAGLDRELVKRQMLGAEAARARQFGLPRGEALARPRIAQVARDTPASGLRGGERAQREEERRVGDEDGSECSSRRAAVCSKKIE